VTVLPSVYLLGYGSRVGALSSLSLAQAGEFALVIVALGVSLGHVTTEITSILALTLVITSTVSTYMIMGNHAVAHRIVHTLRAFGIPERTRTGDDGEPGHGHSAELVVLGFHRVASSLVYQTQGSSKGHDVLVVDFSPEVYQKLAAMDVPVLYGDISHLDTLEHVGIERASVVVSTVSEDFLRGTDNLTLLRQIRRLNPDARVILSAETLERARAMYEAGADYVVLPRLETARAFLDVLDALERGDLGDLRERALADLQDREEVLA
jgi:voltage-gated potassium channel Kch